MKLAAMDMENNKFFSKYFCRQAPLSGADACSLDYSEITPDRN